MTKKEFLINFIIINITLMLMPIGDIFYLIPSKITSGGLYGIGIIVTHLLGLESQAGLVVPIVALSLNIPIFIYAYFNFSKDYFNKTFYATAMLPIYMILLASLLNYINYEVIESNIAVSTFLGSLIPGIGIGIIMGLGGSTGGSDTIAKIINKYFPKISLGLGVTITNLIITSVTALMFGIDRALASVISIVLTGWFIDLTLWAGFRKKLGDL